MKRRDRRVNLKQELKDAIYYEMLQNKYELAKNTQNYRDGFFEGLTLAITVIERVLNDNDNN